MNLIQKYNLEHISEPLNKFLLQSIKLENTLRGEIKKGDTKLGGLPDFPNNINYPMWKDKPLSFIAQLDL